MGNNFDLNQYYYSKGTVERESIIGSILYSKNGYCPEDIKRINLTDDDLITILYVFKEKFGVIGSNRVIDTFIRYLHPNLSDEVLIKLFQSNFHAIRICKEGFYLNTPLPSHIFEYALELFFINKQKLIKHNPFRMELKEVIKFHTPLSENCKKLIIKYNKEYLPFIGEISDTIREYFFKVLEEDEDLHYNYRNIKNYSEETICEVIKQYPYLYAMVENPTEKINRTLIHEHPSWIAIIENQTEELQLEALNINVDELIHEVSIKHFENPSRKVQYEAVKCNTKNITFIDNPDYKTQKIAIKRNKKNIYFIKNPHEDIMKSVIEDKWDNVVYEIAKDNIHRYSNEFKHYFNKLKIERGIPSKWKD